MKVLVTGGGGFAGLHLLKELVKRPDTVVAATALDPLPKFDRGDPLEAVEWFAMDVRSAESVREVVTTFVPDRVYHLAGQASVGRSFGEPLETWDVNASGTMRLMVALAGLPRASRRVLVVSSAEVYGEVRADRQPIPEGSELNPVTPYGVSKAGAELCAKAMSPTAGVEVVIARSFNHIGPGQDERFVIPSIALQLSRARRGECSPIVRVGNVEVDRDFLDVRDVARGYVHLMDRGVSGEAYNVCSGEGRSLLAVIERLIELSETGATLEHDASRTRPVDIPRLVGDPTKINALGWRPEIGLDGTLRSLLDEAAN